MALYWGSLHDRTGGPGLGEGSLISRGEGDTGLNSPTVQFEANMAQDRLRANSGIGCQSSGNCWADKEARDTKQREVLLSNR